MIPVRKIIISIIAVVSLHLNGPAGTYGQDVADEPTADLTEELLPEPVDGPWDDLPGIGAIGPVVEPADEAAVESLPETKGRQMERAVMRQLGEAGFLHARLLLYREEKYGINSVETLQPIEALAWIYMEKDFYAEAEVLYRRAVKIRKEKLPRSYDNIKKIGIIYFYLGDAYLYRNLFEKAEENFDQSMSYARDSGHKGDVLSRKGIIYERLEDPEKAADYYLEAVERYKAEKSSKPSIKKLLNRRLLYAYNALIRIYGDMEENEKAAKYRDLVDEINKEEAGIVF